ncbi:MAG: 30S ribosomal protein S16 [Defluviitaleaceae bacterium]|nr:30S ribosomal protein S16 [Defluviitaleaceae bacterium]
MVKIRLKRMGAKKTPFYRIVVADARTARDGKTIADLGIYDPTKDPIVFRVDGDEAKKWLGNGAQPTETVRRLFKNNGVI